RQLRAPAHQPDHRPARPSHHRGQRPHLLRQRWSLGRPRTGAAKWHASSCRDSVLPMAGSRYRASTEGGDTAGPDVLRPQIANTSGYLEAISRSGHLLRYLLRIPDSNLPRNQFWQQRMPNSREVTSFRLSASDTTAKLHRMSFELLEF